jgi:hypothetical protein
MDTGLQREVLALCELLFEPPREDIPKLKLILGEPPQEKRAAEKQTDIEPNKRLKLQITAPKKANGPLSALSALPDRPMYVDPELLRKGRTIIDRLRNHPHSAPFLFPVDTSIYTGYLSIVSYPMDLSTAAQKLESGRYGALKDLMADINRIFQNCYIYNLDDSPIYASCKKLEAYFESTVLPDATSSVAPKGTEAFPEKEWKRAKHALQKLKENPYFDFFAWPVDPERDGAPDYFDIVAEPMDFGTIEKRLLSGFYKNMTDYEHDVELIFANCFTYNTNPMV